MKAKLGQRVRDPVSGLEGIVIARTEWLYGCVRVSIQPEGHREGKPLESFAVDEPQIEAAPAPAVKNSKQGHGPRTGPQRAADPR